MRRTIVSSIGLGALCIAAAFLLGDALVAPGVVIGLAMAVGNHRVFQSSAMRFTTTEGKVRRKPFAGSVFLRLGACTAVALLALIFVRPVGWGVVGGLVAFQLLLMVNSLVALLRYQRQQLEVGGGGND